MSRGRSSEKSSIGTTLRGMNCASRKSNRQPILRCSGNWKAGTGRRWESRIWSPELQLHQWIRLLSRLFRARCSEAVSNSSRAPCGHLTGFLPGGTNLSMIRRKGRREFPRQCGRRAMDTLEPTIQGVSGDGSKSPTPASADNRSKLADEA